MPVHAAGAAGAARYDSPCRQATGRRAKQADDSERSEVKTRSGFRLLGWAAAGMLLAFFAHACDERGGDVADDAPRPDSIPRRVEVRLYVARDWAWNEEDTLRVTVVNGTTSTIPRARVHLFVQSPVEVLVDSAVADSLRPELLASGEGTRLTFALDSLASGASLELRQAVRMPPAGLERVSEEYDRRDRFLVRAWLSGPDGRDVALAQDTIRIRAGSEVVAGGCAAVQDVPVARYGIGPVRLRMRATAVRRVCPDARDTTWRGAEGVQERGLALTLDRQPVLLVLDGDSVQRIVVSQPGLETGTGVGVGATLGELRGRYGRMCTGVGEGVIAVWFPAAPGISFGLDVPLPPPDSLPDAARVTSLWVHGGEDGCPQGEER